jgi:4,5-DOPA dioxygenase extradiol
VVRIPSLFVGQGQPPQVLFEDEYSFSLREFGQRLENIRAIVAVSSHWVSPGPIQITSSPSPRLEKNFFGFQPEIYDLSYPVRGDKELAGQIADMLEKEDFDIILNSETGIDHGVWMPLLRIRPLADVPVIQLSLPMLGDPRMILKLGHALSNLRDEGILLMGSGSAAFNPSKLEWSSGESRVDKKIAKFDEWLQKKISSIIKKLVLLQISLSLRKPVFFL